MPLLKLDLHVHTEASSDAHTRREDLPQIIKSKGLDGIALTEHDQFTTLKCDDVIIVPGVEVSSAEGHIIALGVRQLVPMGLAAVETIQRIHEQEGIAIIPPPYDPVCECVKISHLTRKPDAVETRNADALSFMVSNYFARRDARKFHLPEVGGSDSHIPQSIGDCYTVIDSASSSVDDILSAIRAGRVHAEGHPTSIMNKWRKLSYKFK